MNKRGKEINLVLSGGGVRGMAHIGLIKALKEQDFSISAISGSSIGAIIGALYGSGRTIDEMLTFFHTIPLFKYNYLTWSKPGLLDTERYYNMFRKDIPHDDFSMLQCKLYVIATNLEKGVASIFDNGALINPVLASAALPPYFSPVKIEETLYADGGIMNNFPVEPFSNSKKPLFGSNVSMVRDVSRKELGSSLQLAQRTTGLMMYALNKEKLAHCDLLFQPYDLGNIGVLDKKQIDSAYEIGYNNAIKILKNWDVKAYTSS